MRNCYSDYSWNFLAASPSFDGPFFEESVVLVVEDGEDGSFGVIVNKPTGKTLGEIDGTFIGTKLENVEVFDGGPMSRENVSLAICYDNGKDEGAFSFGISPKKAIEILEKNADAKLAAYAGYAGWAANQLKGEIGEGTWVVSNADVNIIFDSPAADMWRRVVLRECPEFSGLVPPKSAPSLN